MSQHSHISSLGLTPTGEISADSTIVGQAEARSGLGIVADLVRGKTFAGQAVLLAGPPGTGKTALAVALSKSLGPTVPFCAMSGSKVYSSQVSSASVLAEYLRRAIGLRVREVKEVYEGEVCSLKVEETESLHGDYVKAVSHVEITLKSAKGTKKLRLDPNVYEGLQKERVAVGDVIYVEANSGAVKRVGRCDAFATEFDLEAEEYVPLPKGDVHKKREVVQDVTMHDLDAANATPQGGQDMLSLMGQMGVPRRTEITAKLRSKVNELVNKYVEQGIAEVVPGVLFIDEVHMLDVKCFSFLSRAIESPLAPILVFATNRGVCQVIGAADGTLSPHGIPSDMLDRVMIVTTKPYSADELAQIVAQRVKAEGVATDDSGIAALATLASERASLRYAIALIGPSAVIAKAAGREQVSADDVQRAAQLFHSVGA